MPEENAKITPAPPRGFAAEEYEARAEAVQRRMAAAGFGALLLSAAADIQYFSGFLTRFWQSPTRPWFLAIPARGKPVAVIPEIGARGMAKTWISDIRCWPSPRPQDEGVSLLVSVLRDMGGKIGMALGAESALRMPPADWLKLRAALPGEIGDCAALLQQQRMIKSPREIEKIRYSARAVSAAFAALPQGAHGLRESAVCRRLQADILQNGADEIPYLAAASGAGGYDTVIMPPQDTTPAAGEVLMIDIGAVYDGYFCDFDRNYAVGKAANGAQKAHSALHRAMRAGIAAARPGNTAAAVWRAMRETLSEAGDVGRMGHGIGVQLTEPPSLAAHDETVLREGMVLAVEPSVKTGEGLQMVCEENIAVGEEAELLTIPAAEELPVIPAA
ncbi:MAG: M24 family metallopeptidase [Gammaproteobacteria bacterium]